MEPNAILQSNMLDILFEYRNKEYGAYELRKKYNKRISMALLITAAIGLLIGAASFLSKAFGSKETAEMEAPDVIIHQIDEIKPPPVLPPPQRVQLPQPIATTRFTPPVIKPDPEVKEDIPPVQEITKVDIETKKGIEDDGTIKPPAVDGSGVVMQTTATPDDNTPFEKVEIEAAVNMAQWRRYLENQLRRPIEDAANSGMTPGQYTVQVRFLVERDGTLTDVHSLNDPGYGLGSSAEDVVRKGPRWSPGEQNGRKVRSYHTQPITFVISE